MFVAPTAQALTACLVAVGILFAPSAVADQSTETALIENAQQVWKGDFDGMRKRGTVRVLVVYNKTMYFLDGPDQHGITYDFMHEFEKTINRDWATDGLPIHVVFIPVTRDQLLPKLLAGQGDIAAANLTITPLRQQQVAFSNPIMEGVEELVITAPGVDGIKTLDDLSGATIHVRSSSSYFESLNKLNAELDQQGLAQVELVEADEHLEDADLLELVNADILEMIVVDSHKAQFWKDIFTEITVHEDLAVNSGGSIAWAFRKNSPKLAKVINSFIDKHKKGTLVGNVLYKRYLADNQWIKNPVAEDEVEKFNTMLDIFRKYAGQYEFDYLMLAAQGYQESGLDQTKRSSVGAVGVMQLLPSTAADPNVDIQDIHLLDNNIHAGTKYLRFLKSRYFSDAAMDDVNQTLFAFASYNAGPNRINKLREEAEQKGLDPNQWFDHVEVIAARRIGQETVHYVGNIYKYYVTYRFYSDRLAARESLGIEE